MAGYSVVQRRIWHNPKFRGLPIESRHLFLYLLTSPHGNRIGMFVLDEMYVAADIQLSHDEVREALAALVESSLVMYDHSVRMVLLPRYLKHNPMTNPNVVKAACLDLADQPFSKPLLEAFGKALSRWGRSHYTDLENAVSDKLANPTTATASEGLGKGFTKGFAKGVAKGLANPVPIPKPVPIPNTTIERGAANPFLTEPQSNGAADAAPKPKGRTWREVPKGWKPTDKHRTLAKELGVSLTQEEAKFRDHYFDKPKKDADKTFNNWLRSAARYNGPAGKGKGLTLQKQEYEATPDDYEPKGKR